jgi:hypothetical protein
MFTSHERQNLRVITFPSVTPTAFLLKIFSTAVRPCPSIEISFEGAKTVGAVIPKVLQQMSGFFYQNDSIRTSSSDKF